MTEIETQRQNEIEKREKQYALNILDLYSKRVKQENAIRDTKANKRQFAMSILEGLARRLNSLTADFFYVALDEAGFSDEDRTLLVGASEERRKREHWLTSPAFRKSARDKSNLQSVWVSHIFGKDKDGGQVLPLRSRLTGNTPNEKGKGFEPPSPLGRLGSGTAVCRRLAARGCHTTPRARWSGGSRQFRPSCDRGRTYRFLSYRFFEDSSRILRKERQNPDLPPRQKGHSRFFHYRQAPLYT